MIRNKTRQKNVMRSSIRAMVNAMNSSCVRDRTQTYSQEQTCSQKQNRRAFNCSTGQATRLPRAGVDVDAVEPDIGMRHWCVSMHDEFAVVFIRVEKLVANPDEIVGILALDRNAGADAGVHEQKVSAAVTVVQALQEQFVGPREYRDKAAAQLSGGFAVARMNAVGGQCLQRAELLPMRKKALVSKKAFHQGLVIAAQAHRAVFDDTNSQRVNNGF